MTKKSTPKGTRLKVFISGPMRGIKQYNYGAFYKAAVELSSKGHDVVNPAALGDRYGDPSKFDGNELALRVLMDYELDLVRTCNAIYLLKGWESSEGACGELRVALEEGLMVFTQDKEEIWDATLPKAD